MSINGDTLGDLIRTNIDVAVTDSPSAGPVQRMAVMRAMGSAIATQVNTVGLHVTDGGSNTGDVGEIIFGSGFTLSVSANIATVTTSGGGGGSYTASLPLAIDGSNNITIAAATDSTAGSLSAADKAKLDGLGTASTHAATDFDAAGSAATAQSNAEAFATSAANAAQAAAEAASDPVGSAAAVTTTSIGAVPTSRTVQATAPLTIAGDNSAHDLSANRVWALTMGSATPLVNGAAAAGSATNPSHEDHIHPHDTAAGVGALGATAVAGGDLAGNYPNPTIATGAVTAAKASTGTGSTNLAIGNDSRFNPAPTTAGRIPYDTGSAYADTAAGTSTQWLQGGTTPSFQLLPALTPGYIPLASGVSVDATEATAATMMVGGTPEGVQASTFAYTGRTATFTLVFTARVVTGQTGYVDLFDTTTGLSVVSGPIACTGSGTLTAYSATVTLSASSHLYELRAGCTGSSAAQYIAINSAAIKVAWS